MLRSAPRAAIIVSAALIVIACSSAAPSDVASPSGRPTATLSTQPRPTESVAADASLNAPTQPPGSNAPTAIATPAARNKLQPDTFAEVVTDRLRVRSAPFVGEESRLLEPLLWDGARLFVIDGPHSGSGYEWYLVEPLGEVDVQIHPDPPPPGWVAAGSRDGQVWLKSSADECFDTPLGWLQFELLSAPVGLIGLSCFGDRPVRFTAWMSANADEGCRATTGPWRVDPAWLGPCPSPAYRLADADADLAGEVHALDVALEPSVDVRPLADLKPDHWLLVDVAGQFANPAADGCRATPTGGDGEGPPLPEVVVLHCREQFVVTELRPHTDT